MSHCARVQVGTWQRGEEGVLFTQCVLPFWTQNPWVVLALAMTLEVLSSKPRIATCFPRPKVGLRASVLRCLHAGAPLRGAGELFT